MPITGSSFVASNTNNNYTVTGIPDGYTLGTVTLPVGWTIVTTGIISGGSQAFTFKSSSNSGSIVIVYNAGSGEGPYTVSLDVSSNAPTQGISMQAASTSAKMPTKTIGDNVKVNVTTVNTVPPGPGIGYARLEGDTGGCANNVPECPFTLNVFADVNNPTLALNNDQSDFIYQGNPLVYSIDMALQKGDGCGGNWSTVLDISAGYSRQASLAITIGTWSGNNLIQGTFTIGIITLPLYYYGTYAGYLTYLATQINRDGTYLCTIQAGGVTIYGKNGAGSNGVIVNQKLNNTSNAFSALMKNGDNIISTAIAVTTKTVNASPLTFGNIEINNGGCYNADGSYTAGTDPIQIFSGEVQFQTNAQINSNYLNGSIEFILKVNGVIKATTTTICRTVLGNGVATSATFSFPPQTLSPGDVVQVFASCTLNMHASGNGLINMGGGSLFSMSPPADVIGSFMSTSTASATTNWGTLEGGVVGVGGFCKWFAYGNAPDFSGNPFTDDYGNQYKGCLLQWLPILQAFGAGQYRMQVTYTMTDTSTQVVIDPRLFCLNQFNCSAIDRTVRVEVWNIGIRGSLFNSNQWTDYGSANIFNNPAYKGWYSQIRVSGIFYETEFPQTREYNQYGDDIMNAKKPIILEANPKYILELAPIPGWMDWYFVINVSQADTILMTDYNSVNRNVLTLVPVIPDGSIKPKVDKLANPLAMVEIAFEYGQNNLRRRND